MPSIRTFEEPYTKSPRHVAHTILGFISACEARFRHSALFKDFFEKLSPDESDRLEKLWDAVQSYERGDTNGAAAAAESVLRSMPDEDESQDSLAMRTFAEAILARASGQDSGGGNLYLGARPPGAQLRAFELLRLRTPLIPFAYAAANRALIDLVDEAGEPTDVTIVDVGIGRGGQLRALLRNPAARRLLRSLRVIGVEPDSSATDSGALQLAEQNVLRTAAEVGVPASFCGIPKVAEELTAADITGAQPTGLLLGNSAFALHHVVAAQDPARAPWEQAPDRRDVVLRTLRQAGVQALVLVEPDSNHFEDELPIRFLYAYRHYRTVSQSLKALLPPADASLVWGEFFAPEVRNVLAHEGAHRIERHEEIGRWIERLRSVGWSVDALPDLLPQSAAPPGLQVAAHGSAFSLLYQGVSILGVIRAR
jgi:hypothetical protein